MGQVGAWRIAALLRGEAGLAGGVHHEEPEAQPRQGRVREDGGGLLGPFRALGCKVPAGGAGAFDAGGQYESVAGLGASYGKVPQDDFLVGASASKVAGSEALKARAGQALWAVHRVFKGRGVQKRGVSATCAPSSAPIA